VCSPLALADGRPHPAQTPGYTAVQKRLPPGAVKGRPHSVFLCWLAHRHTDTQRTQFGRVVVVVAPWRRPDLLSGISCTITKRTGTGRAVRARVRRARGLRLVPPTAARSRGGGRSGSPAHWRHRRKRGNARLPVPGSRRRTPRPGGRRRPGRSPEDMGHATILEQDLRCLAAVRPSAVTRLTLSTVTRRFTELRSGRSSGYALNSPGVSKTVVRRYSSALPR
jgi:hypothetical protein